MKEETRVSKWYFGGLSSAGAACFTHPLDLLKVAKQSFTASGKEPEFYKKVAIAGLAGAAGGLVGTPADLVNVRMQNDSKLAPELRRNYKNAIEGLYRVCKDEGISRCFSGASMATGRAILMTIGQLSFYDLFKNALMSTGRFEDNPTTHFVASLSAGAVATTLTQPLDVLKTRAMNAKPGEFKGIVDLFMYTAKLGPLGFYKGYVPAFVRLAPQTILTFLFMEQLRVNFGTIKKA